MKKHAFNIFPEAKEEDFKELLEDIRSNGYDQTLPIITYQGDILDGWNRWRACQILNIKPPMLEFTGDNDADALAYTLRTNKRRNMPSGQKAALAVEAEELMAKIRDDAAKNVGGRPKKLPEDRPQKELCLEAQAIRDASDTDTKEFFEKLQQKIVAVSPNRNVTDTKAAELFGTNRTYINQAAKLRAEAPEVFEKLKAGKTTMQEARKEAARKPTEPEWLPDEIERKAKVEAGETVVANLQRDKHLIQWASQNGKMMAIDRTSKWGNPFILGPDGDRNRVCDCFEKHYAPNKDSFIQSAHELKGKVLCCHCYPERCHGDSLIALFNDQ
jgi:ParB-like chromosome segregation protein Spo0J